MNVIALSKYVVCGNGLLHFYSTKLKKRHFLICDAHLEITVYIMLRIVIMNIHINRVLLRVYLRINDEIMIQYALYICIRFLQSIEMILIQCRPLVPWPLSRNQTQRILTGELWCLFNWSGNLSFHLQLPRFIQYCVLFWLCYKVNDMFKVYTCFPTSV